MTTKCLVWEKFEDIKDINHVRTLIELLRWKHRYINIAHLRNFIRGVFTNFDILWKFQGLVKMQTLTVGKGNLKVKM